jgi:hypothetical protein
LRNRFKATYDAINGKDYQADELISLHSGLKELGKLTSELSRPTYKFNGAGKMLVDKSPDGTKSPNLADAVMMCFSSYRNSTQAAVANLVIIDTESKAATETCGSCEAFNGGVCRENGYSVESSTIACDLFYPVSVAK